jgi:alkylation response protein AidB-like acyl-CoA dehydrogenase
LLLGPGVTGPALEAALDRTVLALSAAALGSMEVVMATTADYLKTRVQYGKPLAQFQALQHRMSEMFVETDQARAALWRAIAAVAADTPEEPPRRAVSAAKWLISRAGLFVTEQGIQLHGGIGTTEECVVGHHYRAMLAFDKRLGDADFHLDRSSDLLEETR